MAELFFHFGRKCHAKNLVSPKKSSTFAASKEKEISINQKNNKIMAKFLKRHWGKDLEIETYITKGGKVRATINGRKADKCALGMIADACSYAGIYWYNATYEQVLNDIIRQCYAVNYMGKWVNTKY